MVRDPDLRLFDCRFSLSDPGQGRRAYLEGHLPEAVYALVAELAAGRATLVDARAPERFRGEREPIDPVSGHIPGAINLPLTGNLDSEGRFLSPAALRERFIHAIGDCSPACIVHSCGSGVNACHNLLAMEVAGLRGSRLYAGSRSEWIRSPERPVAVGAG